MSKVVKEKDELAQKLADVEKSAGEKGELAKELNELKQKYFRFVMKLSAHEEHVYLLIVTVPLALDKKPVGA